MATVSIRYIVTDVGEAVDFYSARLGFEVQMHPNDLFAMLVRDDLRLVLVKPAPPGAPSGGGAAMPDGTMQQPGGWNRFSIEVADIDAAVGELRKSGTRFRNDVVAGTGGRQIILEDPSGNPVELFQPARPEARLARLARLPVFGAELLFTYAVWSARLGERAGRHAVRHRHHHV